MKKLLLLAAFSALLVGCGAKDSGTSTTPPAGASAPAVQAAPPTDAELKKAAAATQESAGTDAEPGDASLERIAAMPESQQLPGGRWKAGTNYKPVVPAQSTSAEPGQVEVIEVLWLGCPHCADLEPFIESWSKKKPPYIKFVQEHVMWGPVHRAHGKLFYTLEALGRNDLVAKAFDEIHKRNNVLVSRTGNDGETATLQLAFATANGVKEADFKREYSGFGVNTRLQRAEDLMRRYRIESVPMVIINGKYETDVAMAGGHDQLIQLINDLAASEKTR